MGYGGSFLNLNLIDLEITRTKTSPQQSFDFLFLPRPLRNGNSMRCYSFIQDFRDSFRFLIIPAIFLASIGVPLLTYYTLESNKQLLLRIAQNKQNLKKLQRKKKKKKKK